MFPLTCEKGFKKHFVIYRYQKHKIQIPYNDKSCRALQCESNGVIRSFLAQLEQKL